MLNVRAVLLTILALLAFAGNSLLCRMALAHTSMDAASFTTVRLLSGALVLWLLVALVIGLCTFAMVSAGVMAGRALGAEKLVVNRLNMPALGHFGIPLQNLSFTVRAGEIFGIAGVAGNGQNALLLALSGEETTDDGDAITMRRTEVALADDLAVEVNDAPFRDPAQVCRFPTRDGLGALELLLPHLHHDPRPGTDLPVHPTQRLVQHQAPQPLRQVPRRRGPARD